MGLMPGKPGPGFPGWRLGVSPICQIVISPLDSIPILADAIPMNEINDWAPETNDLIDALLAGGYTPTKGHNGEEGFKFDPANRAAFVDNLTACDESRLYVACPDGKTRWLYLVLGNCPGEMVSDYLCDDGLDAITSAHYDKWSDRKQPTKLT